MNAFVVIRYDLENLNVSVIADSESESVVCVGVYRLGESELENLQRAEAIYFVASENSMCSTAYQELLFATWPLVETKRCFLLKLDNTKIPSGFPMLQALSEGRPD
jgi:hypothetical protein